MFRVKKQTNKKTKNPKLLRLKKKKIYQKTSNKGNSLG